MALKDGWRSFGDVVSILSDTIGSNLIAWDDVENHLTSGRIRSKADFNRLHELTGTIIKTEERILRSDWWQEPGRFGRLFGRLVLHSEIEVDQINEWHGIERTFDNPTWSCTNIMLWMPNVCALYPDIVDRPQATNADASRSANSPPPVNRRRGPRPLVLERVKAEMRKMPMAELRDMTEEAMKATWSASRDICRKARKEILSEFGK